MAFFSASIFLEYSAALAQADRLENCAGDADQACTAIDAVLADLAGCWQGENAILYANKCRELQRKIKQTATDLRTTANAVRGVARELKKADDDAAAIAASSAGGRSCGTGGFRGRMPP